MPEVSRRDFLRGAATVAALLAASRYTGRVGEAHAAGLPAVAAAQGSNADSAADILKTALDGLGGISRFVKPGQTVAIKPNATWAYRPGTASSTDPGLLEALILMVREAGARRVIVMDRCTLWTTAASLQQNRLGQVVDDLRVEKLFPGGPVAPADLCTAVDLPKGQAFRKLAALKAAVEADVRINMAVAKSHKVTKYTLCLKHMMGFLQTPGQIHVHLEQGIADINTESPIQAHLHILEAIRVRLRGQAGGNQDEVSDPDLVKRPNQVLAGTDPVLIDSYGLQTFFERKPKELAHVFLAAQAGIGEMDVEKAVSAGLLRIFTVGQPTPTPTATATLQSTATAPATATPAGPTSTPSPLPTRTPLPTNAPAAATPVTAADAPPATGVESAPIVDPAPFISSALIPAAAVVLGAGVVLRGRLGRHHEAAAEGDGGPLDEARPPAQDDSHASDPADL